MPGMLYIISAPSGAGKTSLVKTLMQTDPNVTASVSFTTRSPRTTEINGKDYNFVSLDEFQRMSQEGEFLETAQIYDNWYGTAKKDILMRLQTSDVVLEIDWQGARQVTKMMDWPTVSIFILPPSLQELEKRLRGRGQDVDDVIRKRLATAKEEIRHAHEYQFVIINDEFEKASQQLNTIVQAFRLHRTRQTEFLNQLLIKE